MNEDRKISQVDTWELEDIYNREFEEKNTEESRFESFLCFFGLVSSILLLIVFWIMAARIIGSIMLGGS